MLVHQRVTGIVELWELKKRHSHGSWAKKPGRCRAFQFWALWDVSGRRQVTGSGKFNGIYSGLMGFYSGLMGFYSGLMGFYSGLMGFIMV